MKFGGDIRPPDALKMCKWNVRHAVHQNRDCQQARDRRAVVGKITSQPNAQPFRRKNHQNQREREAGQKKCI